jgi:hypothetical protein
MLKVGRSWVRFPLRLLEFSVDLILPVAICPWCRLSLQQNHESSWGKTRPVHKADNLTAICEPIFSKMWEPRCLTTLWASTACYRESFTFFTLPFFDFLFLVSFFYFPFLLLLLPNLLFSPPSSPYPSLPSPFSLSLILPSIFPVLHEGLSGRTGQILNFRKIGYEYSRTETK